jgi:hypothetical protein
MCKLDMIPENRPSQRAVVAIVLVELQEIFHSLLSRSKDRLGSGQYAEMDVDFRNFVWITCKTFTFRQMCPSSPLSIAITPLELSNFVANGR